ncbi:MAG TPA: hypothetical protein VH851_07940, partial [Candidatus Binatia bacterium]
PPSVRADLEDISDLRAFGALVQWVSHIKEPPMLKFCLTMIIGFVAMMSFSPTYCLTVSSRPLLPPKFPATPPF